MSLDDFEDWPVSQRRRDEQCQTDPIPSDDDPSDAPPAAQPEPDPVSAAEDHPPRHHRDSERLGGYADRPVVVMKRTAFEKLRTTVGRLPHERGGIFVCRRHSPFVIEDFIFDKVADTNGGVYYPHAEYLNGILERDYEPEGFFFAGVGHSHPPGLWRPSGHARWGDVKAARNNLRARGNEHLPVLFIPIIESEASTGRFHIHPFVMLRDGFSVQPVRLEIVTHYRSYGKDK
jgi:hypothetical protein